MADSPKVTLLMATYHRPKLLVNALESVKNQRRRPDEVIVISDGDKEAATIAREYVFCNVIDKKHEGVYAAWNAGIAVAIGDWITYLGDDDILRPNYIDDMLAGMEADNYKHNYYYSNDMPAYYSDTNKKMWDSTLESYNERTIVSDFPRDVMRRRTGRLPSSGAFYLKSLYHNRMYKTQYTCGEDNFWLIRMAVAGLLRPLMLKVSGYIVYRYRNQMHHVSQHVGERARIFADIGVYLEKRGYGTYGQKVGGRRVR